MKQMILEVFENVLTFDNQQEGDNNATELTIDFTNCDVTGMAKWVDFVVADGSKVAVSLGVATIPTYNLPNSLTKEGVLLLQAYAKNGVDVTYLSKVFRVTFKRSLNAIGDDTHYEISAIEALQDAISLMEITVNAIWTAYENGEFDGTDGDSAYQLAVAGGYVGTLEQWIASLKGETGSSGVIVSSDEPTDPEITVWVDPDEEGLMFNTKSITVETLEPNTPADVLINPTSTGIEYTFKIPKGIDGVNINLVGFSVNETGEVIMTTTTDYEGASFAISNEGNLEVTY